VFYLNVETGEAAWSAPPGGYINTEGLLVLATGKVRSDQIVSKRRRRRKKCSCCLLFLFLFLLLLLLPSHAQQ
jgi:hypothetical protein